MSTLSHPNYYVDHTERVVLSAQKSIWPNRVDFSDSILII